MTTTDLRDALPEIAGWIDRSESLFLGLDFDGTLTPIRPRPDQAILSDPVRGLLAHLASLPRLTLMIVSGRSLEDVSRRVGLPGLFYAGNHGLEIRGPGLAFLEPTAASLADRLRELTILLEERLANLPEALVEPKGLTTSVHYRNVPREHWERLAQVVRDVAESDPDRFVLTTGHRIWEIRPRVSWHKGQAIHWVLQHLETSPRPLVFSLGDDLTDEDAFASLPDDVTVRVGLAPHSHARYRLADPAAVEWFLTWLEASWTRKLSRIS